MEEPEVTEEIKEETTEEITEEPTVIEEIEANFTTKSDVIGKKIRGLFNTELKDLGNGVMEAVISSEIVDRHGESISMKGMDIKEYMKNPIIADAHNYDLPSVGRTLKLTKTSDGKLISKFEFAKDIYDKAKLYYDLYKDKFQFAFSIGFIAEEMDGNTYTKSKMIEFSPVLVPANPEALMLGIKKGLDTDFLNAYNLVEVKNIDEPKTPVAEEPTEETPVETPEPEVETPAEETEEVKGLKEELAQLKADAPKVKAIAQDPAILDKKDEVSKEMKFLHFVRALKNKDFSDYKRIVGKDAMNTTDDSVVVPPFEFVTAVERLEEQYGVARRNANLRRSTSGAGVKFLFGQDDVAIFDTEESGVKQSTKNSYQYKLLEWRKFAGILPITDELTEDAAIDLWSDATQRFARAYAKQEDSLVFTEASDTGVKNFGIVNEVGTNPVLISGDSIADLSYDNLVDMIYSIPTASSMNGKFYFNHTVLGVIMKIRDGDNRLLWQPAMADGTPATILGKPYELTEVLPGITDDAPSTAFIVFGDLKYVTLGERNGLAMKVFDSGVVGDPDEEDQDTNTINLLTQDVQALRCVKRMNAVVRFPAAFSVASTAATS